MIHGTSEHFPVLRACLRRKILKDTIRPVQSSFGRCRCCSPSAQCASSKKPHFLKRGNAQMAKKGDARAVLEFRSAAQAMPNHPEPYYQLGFGLAGNR